MARPLFFAFSFAIVALASAAGAQPPPNEEITPPVIVHRVEPAVAPTVHADVVLIVTVDAQGTVKEIEVSQSSGDAALDQSCVDAVRKWTYSPATRADGRTIAARIKEPFHFTPPPPPQKPAPPPPKPREPTPVAEPEDITIHGQSYLPARGAGDYDIAVGNMTKVVPTTDAAHILRLAPGTFLTNVGGEGHPYQIFLRGFDAREGQDLEFTVDGIPINEVGNPHGNGLADTKFIIPELVRNLRVIEGVYAPQQGNFAVAGSALFDVGLEHPGLSVTGTYGSFNTQRLLLTFRPSGFTQHTFGAAELYQSDGFGQNRASQRGTAMAGYETKLGQKGFFRVLGTAYASHYAQGGVLRDDDVTAGRKDFFGTYDTTQGGDSGRYSLGMTLGEHAGDLRLLQSAFLVYRDFRVRQNLTGFLLDPQETWQSPHPQRGDLLDQRSQTVTGGGRGSARWETKGFGLRQELELGYYARVDSVNSVQQKDRAGTEIPYKTMLDLGSTISNIGTYADASVRPVRWMTVRGGIRGDLFHYNVTNHCALTSQASTGGDPADTECFESDRQGYRSANQTASTSAMLFQPRGTVLFGPFRHITLSASAGVGSRSIDPQYINQDLKTPFATVTGGEGGAAYQRHIQGTSILVRSVFFSTHVNQDQFFNATEGRATLAAGTTRTGWAGNARVTGTFYDLATSLTVVKATFDDTHLLIPYVPPVVFRADGALFGTLPFSIANRKPSATLGLGAGYVAQRPLPYDERSNDIFLVDVGASVTYANVTVGVMIMNLFDNRYRVAEYNYTSDFHSQPYPTLVPARHFIAGEPRTIYGTLTIAFGGPK